MKVISNTKVDLLTRAISRRGSTMGSVGQNGPTVDSMKDSSKMENLKERGSMGGQTAENILGVTKMVSSMGKADW